MNRSFLIFPSYRSDFIIKAINSKSDYIIFDLEDSVAADLKNKARKNIKKFLSIKNKTFVRLSDQNSKSIIADIKSSQFSNLIGYVIPKVNSSKDLKFFIKLIKKYSKTKDFKIILLVENMQAILNLKEIVEKNKKYIFGLMFGHEDFASNLFKYFNENEKIYDFYKSQILLISKSYDLIAIDTPTLEFKNIKIMKKYYKNSFKLGFDGALLIHPNQIESANNSFSVMKNDYQKALELLKKSKKKDSIYMMKDEFIGPPLLRRAQYIVKSYEISKNIKKRNIQ